MASSEDVMEDFRSSLSELTQNSKPLISMITMLADDNRRHADLVVKAVETHLQRTAYRLPCLYLIDSIIKNVQTEEGDVGGGYLQLFSKNIVFCFLSTFEKVDEKTRQAMFKLRQTWTDLLPNKLLYSLDYGVNRVDPAWPITAERDPIASTGTNIHVNPKFLLKQQQQQQQLLLSQQQQQQAEAQTPSVTSSQTRERDGGSDDKRQKAGRVAKNKVRPVVAPPAKPPDDDGDDERPIADVLSSIRPGDETGNQVDDEVVERREREKSAMEERVLQELLLQQHQKQEELLRLRQMVLENELAQARAKLEEQARQQQLLIQQQQQQQQQQKPFSSSVTAAPTQVKISAAIAPSTRDPRIRTQLAAANKPVSMAPVTMTIGSTVQQTAVVLPTYSKAPAPPPATQTTATLQAPLSSTVGEPSTRAGNIWERVVDLNPQPAARQLSPSQQDRSWSGLGSLGRPDANLQKSGSGQSSVSGQSAGSRSGDVSRREVNEIDTGQNSGYDTMYGMEQSGFDRMTDSRLLPGVTASQERTDNKSEESHGNSRDDTTWKDENSSERKALRGGRFATRAASFAAKPPHRGGFTKSPPEERSEGERKSRGGRSMQDFKIPRLIRGRGVADRRTIRPVLRSPVGDRPPLKRAKMNRPGGQEDYLDSGDIMTRLFGEEDDEEEEYRHASPTKHINPPIRDQPGPAWVHPSKPGGPPTSDITMRAPPRRGNVEPGGTRVAPGRDNVESTIRVPPRRDHGGTDLRAPPRRENASKRALLPTPPLETVERPSLLGKSPGSKSGGSLQVKTGDEFDKKQGQGSVASLLGDVPRTVANVHNPLLSNVASSSGITAGKHVEEDLQNQMQRLQRMREELEEKKRQLYTQSLALTKQQQSNNRTQTLPPLPPPPMPPKLSLSTASVAPSRAVSMPIPFRRQSSATNEFWEAPPVPWYDTSLYYVPEHDARWLLRAAVSQTGGTEAYCIVIDGRQYEMTINNRPRQIKLNETSFIDVRLDPASRQLWVNDLPVYHLGDEPREAQINGRTHTVWANGPVRKIWIDRQQFEINVDAPPERINIGGREHKIRIDGDRNWIIVDGFDICPFGTTDVQKVTLAFIVHTIQFKAPPKQILIDGSLCDLDLSGKYPHVIVGRVRRGIRFDGADREIYIDDVPLTVPVDKALKWRQEIRTPSGPPVSSKPRLLALGGPGHEIIIDDQWYEVKFGGNAKFVKVGGRVHKIELRGEAPEVKILGEMVAATDLGRVLRGQQPASVDEQTGRQGLVDKAPMMRPPQPPQRPPLSVPSEPHHLQQWMGPGGERVGGQMARFVDQQQQAGGEQRLMAQGGPPPGGYDPRFDPQHQQHQIGRQGLLPQPFQQQLQPAEQVDVNRLQQNTSAGGGAARTSEDGGSSAEGVMAKPVDVDSLLNKLLAAGLIQAAAAGLTPSTTAAQTTSSTAAITTTAEQTPATTTTSVTSSITTASVTTATVSDEKSVAGVALTTTEDGELTAEAKKALELEESSLPSVPDMTSFIPAELRRRHVGAIRTLRLGLQCSTCGLRFRAHAVESAAYKAHLDWHFRANKRAKERERTGHSRGWFFDDVDWIQYEELADQFDESEGSNEDVSDAMIGQTTEEGGVLGDENGDLDDRPTALGDECADACAQCKEAFEQYWDEDAEAWRLKDAIRFKGHLSKTYHRICFEDAKDMLAGEARLSLEGEGEEEGAVDTPRGRVKESWAEVKAELATESVGEGESSEMKSDNEDNEDETRSDTGCYEPQSVTNDKSGYMTRVKSEPVFKMEFNISEDDLDYDESDSEASMDVDNVTPETSMTPDVTPEISVTPVASVTPETSDTPVTSAVTSAPSHEDYVSSSDEDDLVSIQHDITRASVSAGDISGVSEQDMCRVSSETVTVTSQSVSLSSVSCDKNCDIVSEVYHEPSMLRVTDSAADDRTVSSDTAVQPGDMSTTSQDDARSKSVSQSRQETSLDSDKASDSSQRDADDDVQSSRETLQQQSLCHVESVVTSSS